MAGELPISRGIVWSGSCPIGELYSLAGVWDAVGQAGACGRDLVRSGHESNRRPHLWRLHVQRCTQVSLPSLTSSSLNVS